MTWFMLAILPALQVQEPTDRIRVVTTLGVLRYAAEQVGGDRVEVEALAPPGQDPHFIIPSPDLQRKAARADLFILVGRRLELWAKKIIDFSGNPAIQSGKPGYLIASTSCSVEELPEQVTREWGDLHPEGNPHVWLDPMNMKIMARNIAERLKKIDPEGAATYDKNLKAFERRLGEALFGKALIEALGAKRIGLLERRLKAGELDDFLKRWKLQDKLGGWLAKARPLRGMKIITYHKTYIYFAKVFGLEIVGELEERPGIPPSPKYRDHVVDLVRRKQVKAILNDNFYSKAAAEYVARETGAKVLVTYIDVGASDEVPDYFALIDRLIEALLEAR